MDATAGDGDPFWELYADHLLPQPEALCLPMCWPPELLQELQHTAIIDAALQQQVRMQLQQQMGTQQHWQPGQQHGWRPTTAPLLVCCRCPPSSPPCCCCLQERLRSLLPPEYSAPIEPGLPSYLQWGFACVRSRACQLGKAAFGMVPFGARAEAAGARSVVRVRSSCSAQL